MSWARLDDQVAFHAKTVAAGNEAFGAWVRMLAWSCAHMTDGKVPRAVARSITSAKSLARLLEVRLLDADGDGYAVHDFLDWNPSAEQERAKRTARADAGRIGGRRSGANRSNGEAKGEANASQVASGLVPGCFNNVEAKANPVPVPVPVHTQARAREGVRVPAREDRQPMSPEAVQILASLQQHPALAPAAHAEFADRLASKLQTGKRLDWLLAAIRKAGDVVPSGWTEDAVRSKVANYCDRASAADVSPPGPRGVVEEPRRERKPPAPVPANALRGRVAS